jgi:beta-galactosidase
MFRLWLTLGWFAVVVPTLSTQGGVHQDEFLYGATVYPEFMTREQRQRMLEEFQRARFKVLRVGESSWGSLETSPGVYNFGWLREFLDELARRKMKAILGTATYIAPQWLTGRHPETLVQMQPGVRIHPMYRHAACLNHPLYREACRRYIRAAASEFRDHPAVIAWQLDNEVEFLLNLVCHNPACETAWAEWLRKTYRTPEEFNRRLNLESWAMQVGAFEEVPQPNQNEMGDARRLAALTLAHRRFRRDVIAEFMNEQTQLLRQAGVKLPITHDFFPTFPTLADDPQALKALDIAGFNIYPPVENATEAWLQFAWFEDVNRSALGLDHFWVTEARFGNAAVEGTAVTEPAPTREQARMWCLQSTALGGTALLFWTGNRWRGGHWPHWGGLLDWTGQPEPDFEWAVELGEFYDKWGSRLIQNPVNATAAVLTDFELRLALQTYPHVPGSPKIVAATFDALHRLGIGADGITARRAKDVSELRRYSLITIPAASALDDAAIPPALEDYVRSGGRVVILPLTAYQDQDGIFRGDGFGANLAGLTGTLVRTVRRVGPSGQGGPERPRVAWTGGAMAGVSPVGCDGFVEFMDVAAEAQILARFESKESYLNGKPAATSRRMGSGAVFRLAFWPGDDSLLRLLAGILGGPGGLLNTPAPPGVLAVPRTDGSMFIVNTKEQSAPILLKKPAFDRIAAKKLAPKSSLAPFEVVWLECGGMR